MYKICLFLNYKLLPIINWANAADSIEIFQNFQMFHFIKKNRLPEKYGRSPAYCLKTKTCWKMLPNALKIWICKRFGTKTTRWLSGFGDMDDKYRTQFYGLELHQLTVYMPLRHIPTPESSLRCLPILPGMLGWLTWRYSQPIELCRTTVIWLLGNFH